MIYRWNLVVLCLLICGCGGGHPRAAPAVTPAPTIQPSPIEVDIFDPDLAVVEQVESRHGHALLALQRDHSQSQIDRVIREIQQDGIYPYVKPTLVTYYKPRLEYLTIDIVTQADAAWRMPFRTEPSGTYADPDGLIAAWYSYEHKVFELLERGESMHATQCPILHCLGNPQHPELRDLAARLAPAFGHIAELATILRDDHVGRHRAAAPYLMAYAQDGRGVVTALEAALDDPDPLVRNNAMRVLAEIARTHPEVEVPLDPILAALDYPATSDRNKAAAIIEYLLERPNATVPRRRIVQAAGKTLLAMLRLHQPNNHDFAYKILKIISGQAFGERDVAAWQAWLAQPNGP